MYRPAHRRSAATAGGPIKHENRDEVIAAEVQYAVMGRSLAIALLLAAPIMIWMWRKFQRELRAIELEKNPPVEVVADLHSLEGLLDDLALRAEDLPEGETLHVDVPHDVTLDGQTAPQAIIDPLFADNCRQLGLTITNISPLDDARRFVVLKERS